MRSPAPPRPNERGFHGLAAELMNKESFMGRLCLTGKASLGAIESVCAMAYAQTLRFTIAQLR